MLALIAEYLQAWDVDVLRIGGLATVSHCKANVSNKDSMLIRKG